MSGMPKYSIFDVTKYLDSPQAIEAYFRVTCDDGTPAEIAQALGFIVKAQAMTALAERTGLSRSELYAITNREHEAKSETLDKIAEALGLRSRSLSKPAGSEAA